jgi:hypothetical protein
MEETESNNKLKVWLLPPSCNGMVSSEGHVYEAVSIRVITHSRLHRPEHALEQLLQRS